METVLTTPSGLSISPVFIVGSEKELELMTVKQSLPWYIDFIRLSSGPSH
jgi:hypothetical protein